MGLSLSNYFNTYKVTDYIPLVFIFFGIFYGFKRNKKVLHLDFVKPVLKRFWVSLANLNFSEVENNKSRQILKDHEERMRAEEYAFKSKLEQMNKEVEEHAKRSKERTEETILKIRDEEEMLIPENSYYNNYVDFGNRKNSPLTLYYKTADTMFSPVPYNLQGHRYQYRPLENLEILNTKQMKF